MEQPTFSDLEYQGKKRKARRKLFLERVDGLIPWQKLEGRIQPFYPKAGRGRLPYPLSVMLRVHCVQLRTTVVWELLDRLGMPQKELAPRSGISAGYPSQLMSGVRCPSLQVQRRLQEVLGVEDFDLLFITEPPEAAGRELENSGALQRKKRRTEAGSAGATPTCAIAGNRPRQRWRPRLDRSASSPAGEWTVPGME